MTRVYYAYIHAKPDGTPFYVGKGFAKRAQIMKRRNTHHTNTVGKYGEENILIGRMECSSEATAFELERGLIKCLRRMGCSLVNQTDGGEGPSGAKHSAATLAKLKGNRNAKGAVRSAAAKALVSAARKGKPLSVEHCAKLSMAHKGQTVSEYTKQRLREVHTGNQYNTGRKLSAAHKNKISESCKGHDVTAATREKIRVANVGREISEETRRKLRDSHKGKIMSDATRLKMSQAQLVRQAAIRKLQIGG